MRRRYWFTNRVVWGLVIFLVAVGIWEFHFKPQYRPFYEEGVRQYQAGRFSAALDQFQRAYVIAPNSTDVLLMMGWSNLKLHRFEEARFYFERTLAIDPRVTEARVGDSFVVLETGRGTIDVEAMATVLKERPNDANMQIIAAGALVDQGENLKAEQMYQSLLGSANYRRAADAALRQLYGLDDTEPIPNGLAAFTKPTELQIRYRARDNAIWRNPGPGWQKFYVNGVNLIPDAPGMTPGMVSDDPGFYSKWLSQVSELGANTLHVYSLLPPAFYRAYQKSGNGVGLLQQVEFDLPADGDLFDKPYDAAKAEIRYAIDAIHGQGNVPHRGRRGSGLYAADVSENVVGILLGGEFEPAAVQTTNVRNPEKTSYTGKYVSIAGATPTEVWIAQMLDYAAQYETDTYGWQHPLAFANHPALDPLAHPTESTATGNDAVSIDESKFRASSSFTAGLFASYEVRPYYPDFMLREQRLLTAVDQQGVNPVAAYVRELRSRISLPLVITDFGIPSAIGVQHIQRGGWNEGGISEAEQAAFLTRMAEAIKGAGCAGASVYQLFDEWYRANGIAATLELPRDRASLWLNEMSPDSRFGLIGFHTSGWQLFEGDGSLWKNQHTLYQNSAPAGPDAGRNLRSVQAAADEGFVYLRLNLSCVSCRGKNSPLPAFAVAINTLPGRAGIQQMPFGNIRVPDGANFLLYVGPDDGRLLVASNYNPFQIVSAPGAPNNNEFRHRKAFVASMQPSGSFEDLVLEIAEPVYGRDGVYYPAQRYSAGTMRRATENIGKPDMNSIAEWYADAAHNAIIIRIPWGKLLVTDPSAMRVLDGVNEGQEFRTDVTQGIDLTVFSLQGGTASDPRSWNVAGSPASADRFQWNAWNNVNPEPYRKASFAAVQKEFGGAVRPDTASGRPSAAGRKGGAR